MGLTAENVAREWEISREEQDAFALARTSARSRQSRAGKFKDEIVPLTVRSDYVDEGGKLRRTDDLRHRRGAAPRHHDGGAGEAAAGLRRARHRHRRKLVADERRRGGGPGDGARVRRAEGLTPLARFVAFAVGGVRPEVMGIGPVVAMPKVLKMANLTLADIDLIELNEAFASQSLGWDLIDRPKSALVSCRGVNVSAKQFR